MTYVFSCSLKESETVNDFEYPRVFSIFIPADDDERAREYVSNLIPSRYSIKIIEVKMSE